MKWCPWEKYLFRNCFFLTNGDFLGVAWTCWICYLIHQGLIETLYTVVTSSQNKTIWLLSSLCSSRYIWPTSPSRRRTLIISTLKKEMHNPALWPTSEVLGFKMSGRLLYRNKKHGPNATTHVWYARRNYYQGDYITCWVFPLKWCSVSTSLCKCRPSSAITGSSLQDSNVKCLCVVFFMCELLCRFILSSFGSSDSSSLWFNPLSKTRSKRDDQLLHFMGD